MLVGSFQIETKNIKLGELYIIKYLPEHKREEEWFFINSEKDAIHFAEQKTKMDKSYHRKINRRTNQFR